MPQALVSPPGDAGYLYCRHTLPVRVMHWINVVALSILLMSGLQIFNAYPELHWGKSSYTGTPALLEISAREGANGQTIGYTRILGRAFDTTGVLGASRASDGAVVRAAFPSWATIPARNGWRWHARGTSSSPGSSSSTAWRFSPTR